MRWRGACSPWTSPSRHWRAASWRRPGAAAPPPSFPPSASSATRTRPTPSARRMDLPPSGSTIPSPASSGAALPTPTAGSTLCPRTPDPAKKARLTLRALLFYCFHRSSWGRIDAMCCRAALSSTPCCTMMDTHCSCISSMVQSLRKCPSS